jgi:hypothetical protein
LNYIKCVLKSWANFQILVPSVNYFSDYLHPYGGGERYAQGVGGKARGKEPLGRPRRRWEDNIMMDLQEVRGGCGNWVELAQDRDRWRALVSTVKKLRVP